MNLLKDVLVYIRRIIKTPSDSTVPDNLLIDYVNRFWILDVDARMQLFDLKTKYQFQTTPGIDKYNMPLYDLQYQPGAQAISYYPVYQGFEGPAYINGIETGFYTQRENFFNIWPNVVQNLGTIGTGADTEGPYSLQVPIISPIDQPNPPFQGIMRGHIDMGGIIATGNNIDPPLSSSVDAQVNIGSVPVTSVESAFFLTTQDETGAPVVLADSGWFLNSNVNYGLLMSPGKAPFGNQALLGGYTTSSNTISYFTGEVNVRFPVPIPQGANINAQCFYFQSGWPRGILFFNNTIILRSPPALAYLVELNAYLTPAAFLSSSQALQFGYMSEYIARGAARKYLSDVGDWEQFQAYEPLFKEQESLVWKRSQRQNTATRTQTIYSQGRNFGNNYYNGSTNL